MTEASPHILSTRLLVTIWLALLALTGSASLAFADDRPFFFIDKGVCPFECCTYRAWGVDKETRLFAEPNPDSPLVATATRGTVVEAVTGEVHTKPGKLVVTRDERAFLKGEVVWVYTYLGEGYFRVWYQGKFTEAEIDLDIYNTAPNDWGRFEKAPDSVWWVRVRTPDGTEGWTNETEHFSNKDGCG